MEMPLVRPIAAILDPARRQVNAKRLLDKVHAVEEGLETGVTGEPESQSVASPGAM